MMTVSSSLNHHFSSCHWSSHRMGRGVVLAIAVLQFASLSSNFFFATWLRWECQMCRAPTRSPVAAPAAPAATVNATPRMQCTNHNGTRRFACATMITQTIVGCCKPHGGIRNVCPTPTMRNSFLSPRSSIWPWKIRGHRLCRHNNREATRRATCAKPFTTFTHNTTREKEIQKRFHWC